MSATSASTATTDHFVIPAQAGIQIFESPRSMAGGFVLHSYLKSGAYSPNSRMPFPRNIVICATVTLPVWRENSSG